MLGSIVQSGTYRYGDNVLLIIALIMDRDKNRNRDQERLTSTDDTLAIETKY